MPTTVRVASGYAGAHAVATLLPLHRATDNETQRQQTKRRQTWFSGMGRTTTSGWAVRRHAVAHIVKMPPC
jgi:hypothetical protein